MDQAVITPALLLNHRNTHRNLQIQWLRALAATMVLLCHTASYQNLMLHNGSLTHVFGADFGYFGVSLFFAISGYLMAIMIRVQNPFMFLIHRVIRIFPLYIVMCLLAWGVRSAFHPISIDPLALLLIPFPGIDYSALTIEWTLIFEMAFYACLFWMAWATSGAQHITWIAAAWLGMIVIASAVSPDSGVTLLLPLNRMLTIAVCAPMAMGLMLPALLKRHVPLGIVALAGIAAFGIGEHFDTVYQTCRWSFGIAAFCLLWLALAIPERRIVAASGRIGRAISRYGDWSYALYLCHVPIIQLIYTEAGTRNVRGLWFACAGLALTCAAIFGELDLNLYRRLKTGVGQIPIATLRLTAITLACVYALIAVVGSWDYHRIQTEDSFAQESAERIAASSTVHSVAAAMQANGYHEANDLKAMVDQIEWLSNIQQMRVTAWALDLHKPAQPVYLAAFRNGVLVASGTPDVMRYDVLKAYHADWLQRRLTGKLMLFFAKDCDANELAVVAYTRDMRFSILPGGANVICR